MTPGPLESAQILKLLSDLVAIPSVNPTLVPDEGHGEGRIAKFACEWLNARGVRAHIEEAAPGRPNVVAEAGKGEGPALVLCGHIDTVGTAGMEMPPFTPRFAEGRIYGRGSCDMKGGVAAAMAAAADCAPDLKGRLMLALVADEEYASLGAENFVSRHRADACIVTEPSDGDLILAHKGFLWVELETAGHAAHGSRWDLGVSAIALMARVVAALERFDADVLRRSVHPMVGPASMHVSGITGGAGISTYAPACQAQLERRTIPGETTEAAMREILEVARGADPRVGARLLFERAPLLCDREDRIAHCVRSAATDVCGRAPAERGVGYWMDAALFAAAGISTVNYGPTGAGAHEAVEWVDADSVESCARVLAHAARAFCGSTDPRAAKGQGSK